MKSCPPDKILPYLEDLLSEEEKETFRRHLATCEDCQKRLREFEAIKALFKTTPEAAKEPSFSRILSDFRRKVRVKKKRFAWRLIFIPVGAAAVILFFFLFRPKAAEVYIPVDISYYDLLEDLSNSDAAYIQKELLSLAKIDIERLEEELFNRVPYEEVLEYLDEDEREALVRKLKGGEM